MKEIRTSGQGGVRDVGEVKAPTGVPINGLASVGRGSLFAARGGIDLTVAAAVLHVTPRGARMMGAIEVVAVFTPPTEDGTGSLDAADWLAHPPVTNPNTEEVVEPCYAQPVPNSVTVGPDGAIYAGELTGLAADASFGALLGLARVWKIEPGTPTVRKLN